MDRQSKPRRHPQEYEDWGGTRLCQGIPLSGVVYALMPMKLDVIQGLNHQLGDFFDHALYHLLRGYRAVQAHLALV